MSRNSKHLKVEYESDDLATDVKIDNDEEDEFKWLTEGFVQG